MIDTVARGEAAITPATAARIIRHLSSRAPTVGRAGARPADRARARRPPAGHRRPAQQGNRRRARDQREHREVPPPEHPREAARPEPDRGRDARPARRTARPRLTGDPCRTARQDPPIRVIPPIRAGVVHRPGVADAASVTERRRLHGLSHRHRPHGLHQLRHLHGHLPGRGTRHVPAVDPRHRDRRPGPAAAVDDGAPDPGRRMHRLRHLHR